MIEGEAADIPGQSQVHSAAGESRIAIYRRVFDADAFLRRSCVPGLASA